MDYSVYCCSVRERLALLAVSTAAGAVISWLFYRSWYGMTLVLPVWLVFRKQYKKECVKKQKEALLAQFKDGMQAVSAALLAGYSVENAWRAAERELRELYGEGAALTEEFQKMNAQIGVNRPVEELLQEFAERSGCEDIENFAGIFAFAKRSGGDFTKIIRTTIMRISGKMEVEREIATVIAGKKLEGRIMNVMPFFILAYLNLTSGDFIRALYGNTAGVLIMSGALLAFTAAAWAAERITDIRV